MATIQVYDDTHDINYNLDYTVENAVVFGSGTGFPNYYIRVSTGQKEYGTTTGVAAEIVLTLPGPDFDVTNELKKRAVIIMDKITGGELMSSSMGQSSLSSSESTMSTSSSLSGSSPSSGSSSTPLSQSSGSSSSLSSLSSESSQTP